MRDLAPPRFPGLLLLILLALAFASGAAGRAVPTVAEARLQAFELSGGVLADLCHAGQPERPHVASCSLCHLVAAGDLPDTPLKLVEIERRLLAAVILPQIRRGEARPRDPATPTRGPPQA